MASQNVEVVSGRVPLVARKEIVGEVGVFAFATPSDEAGWVAHDIKRRIDEGADTDEIVVFSRTNKELARFGVALSALGVPYTLSTREDVLDDTLIERLLLLLRATACFGEEMPLVSAMHVDTLGIDELNIYLLARRASKERLPFIALALAPDAPKDVSEFCKKLKGWTKYGENHSMGELVTLIVRESGLLSRFVARTEAMEKLRVLLRFLEEHQRTHRKARLSELMETLEMLDEYNVLKSEVSSLPGRVILMTAHRGKGLGFEHVYITGMTDSNWGGKNPRTTFRLPGLSASADGEDGDDERRLLYVAITRVKESLTVTYAKTGETGKETMPSRYLAELELMAEEPEISPELSALAFTKPVDNRHDVSVIHRFVGEALFEQGLSVTALNNYLACPWKWFYRSLLRVPEAPNKHSMYGNAVHGALQWFFDAWAKGEDKGKAGLALRLQLELERQSFIESDIKEAIREGKNALSGYYNEYYRKWPRDIENEKKIEVLFDIKGEKLRLTGKLDKIEKNKDGTVRVVDYKTGKAKSENEIRGNTANSNGDIYRQLVFYKLLLDRYENGKYEMTTGEIDFIEPDKKSGKYKKFIFEIKEDEVTELENIVKEKAEEMLTLGFFDKRCEDKKCEYCLIRNFSRFIPQ